jgi:UDP-N-acetylglucosamine:LPS N-acetylglucosamine transferase
LDLPPGLERRVADLIERNWRAGFWLKRLEEIAPTIERLLTDPEELETLRANALARARPHAARDAAQAILRLGEKGS